MPLTDIGPPDDARSLLPVVIDDAHQPSEEDLELATQTAIPDLAHIVRKSNDLVRAHYSLGLNATRVLAYALAVTDSEWVRQHQQFPLMKIPLMHVAEVFPALQRNNDIYDVMRQACVDLFEARIEIPMGKRNEKLLLRWAPTCSVIAGHIVVRLHYDLAPHLLDLKEKYTPQSLMYVVELRDLPLPPLRDLPQLSVPDGV